jgi:anti-sigma B factor antagonist
MHGLQIEQRDGVLLAALHVEVTLESIQEIKSELEQALAESGRDVLVLDLSGVNFMDSSGISFLVALNTTMNSHSGLLYLYRPAGSVLKALELVQLRNFFNILMTEDELAALLPE